MKRVDVRTQTAIAALLLASSGTSFAEGSDTSGISAVHRVSHALAADANYAASPVSNGGYKWGNSQDSSVSTSNATSAWTNNQQTRDGYKWDDARSETTASQVTPSSSQMAAKNSAEQQGYKWGVRNDADQAGYKWGVRNDADQAGYKWGVRNDADQAGYKWGVRNDADQAGYKWGVRNDADQAGYKWGVRNDADQAGYKWGVRNDADQAGYKWGVR